MAKINLAALNEAEQERVRRQLRSRQVPLAAIGRSATPPLALLVLALGMGIVISDLGALLTVAGAALVAVSGYFVGRTAIVPPPARSESVADALMYLALAERHAEPAGGADREAAQPTTIPFRPLASVGGRGRPADRNAAGDDGTGPALDEPLPGEGAATGAMG